MSTAYLPVAQLSFSRFGHRFFSRLRTGTAGDSRSKMREIEKCHQSLLSRQHTTTCCFQSVAKWQANCPDFRTIGALAAAADMRITPDLLQRSRKKITPHIPQKKVGPQFFDFPPYFFKVADLRFGLRRNLFGRL